MLRRLALCCVAGLAPSPAADPPFVVYTSHPPGVYEPVLASFRASNPKVAVEAIEIPGATALERLRGEKRDPRASVWWGGDEVSLAVAAREGLLAPSRPAWSHGAPASTDDPQDLWHGQFLVPIALVTRRGAADRPRLLEDLSDSRYRGRLLLRRVTDSTAMRLFLGAMIQAHLSTGGLDRALDWCAMLDGNLGAPYEADGRRLLARVAAASEGEPDVTVWTAPEAARLRDEQTLPIEIEVLPGSPAWLEGVAKVANAPSSAAADRFIELVGRDEWLAGYVAQGRLPVPEGRADAATLPTWMADGFAYTRGVARDELADSLPVWMEALEARIRGVRAPTDAGDRVGLVALDVVDVAGTVTLVAVLVVLLRRRRATQAA
ncbi:MAG TPA: hypothetical protein VKE69_07520 [Planctomycetota bacterium]|nr:hypothetical protein [Planctomycetota bacterium]